MTVIAWKIPGNISKYLTWKLQKPKRECEGIILQEFIHLFDIK